MDHALLSHPGRRTLAGGSLLAAAAAWPSAMGALTYALASPYERALASAWCGAAPHAANVFAAHCAACWTGAAMLAAAGLAVLVSGAKVAR